MANEQRESKTEALQLALLEMQLDEARRTKGLREEEDRRVKRQKELGAKALAQQREIVLATQSQCPHRKPNAQSAVAGQWDHSGTMHWICAYCAKEWTGNELPISLRVDMSRVGGPERAVSSRG